MVKKIGLTKPQHISPVLADVLGVSKDKMLSKVEVVERLWKHIKSKKLQDKENKHFINPDDKMAEIFGNGPIKSFGMAKCLKEHFIT